MYILSPNACPCMTVRMTALRAIPILIGTDGPSPSSTLATLKGVAARVQLDVMCAALAVVIFAFLGFREPHALAAHAPGAYLLTMGALLSMLLGLIWAQPRAASTDSAWCALLQPNPYATISPVHAGTAQWGDLQAALWCASRR